MKKIKKVLKLLRIFLFALMFAVCMVLGIAPFIPKRKEKFEIEIKIEETKEKDDITNLSNWLNTSD